MSVVRHAAQAGTLTLALVAALAAAGCGSDSKPADDRGARARGLAPSVEIGVANCADWRESDAFERKRILDSLRAFAGGPVGASPGRGAVLDDGNAGRLFDARCADSFARGFKLYKLYGRAAAFDGR